MVGCLLVKRSVLVKLPKATKSKDNTAVRKSMSHRFDYTADRWSVYDEASSVSAYSGRDKFLARK